MSKNLSAKYYQENKERLQKKSEKKSPYLESPPLENPPKPTGVDQSLP